MKVQKSQLIVSFVVGCVACAISGGSPIVLLMLMAFLAAGAFACNYFELTVKLPKNPLTRFLTNTETKPVQSEGFVLGIGHQVRR